MRAKTEQPDNKVSMDMLKAATAALIGFLVLLGTAQDASAVTCLGYWTMDTNVSNTTGTGNWPNCTMGDLIYESLNVSTHGVAGYIDQGFYLPGSGYFKTRNSTSITGRDNMTLSFWMKLNNTDLSSMFFGMGSNLANQRRVMQLNGVDKISYTQYANDVTFNPPTIPAISDWVFISLVHNGTHTFLYANGTLQDNKSMGSGTATANSIFWFGAKTDGAVPYPKGIMDDVSIFKEALDPGQILGMYVNGTKSIFTPASDTPVLNNLSIAGFDLSGNPLSTMNETVDGAFWQNLTGNFIQTTNLTQASMDITIRSDNLFDAVFTNYNATATNTTLNANLTPYANITVVDAWDNASLIFNATIYNMTHSTDYANQVQLRPAFQGVHYVNLTRGGYFPQNGLSVNLSGGTATRVELAESFLYISGKEWLSNSSLPVLNVTIRNGTTVSKFNMTTTGNISFGVRVGEYNISITAPGHYPNHSIVTAVILEGAQTMGDLASSLLAVNATQMNVSIIPAFMVTVTGITYPGVTITKNVTAGTAYFYLVNGSWNISFSAQNYIPNSTLFTITSLRHNYTFQTWKLNTVNITFRSDNASHTLMSGTNITLEFTGDAASYIFNTTTGTLFRELLSPSDYLLEYYAGGYVKKYYAFTLTNITYSEFSLYMTPQGATTNVTLTVKDENSAVVEGITVQSLIYDLGTNSYLQSESSITDSQGEVIMHLYMFDTYYRFRFYKGTTLLKTTDAATIKKESLEIQVQLTPSYGEPYYSLIGIYATLNWTQATENFAFDYTDPKGTTARGCLQVYTWGNGRLSLVNESCVDTASGTLLIAAPAQNGTTYVAYGSVVLGGTTYYLVSAVKSFAVHVNTEAMGLFLSAAIIVTLASAFYFSSPLVAIVGGIGATVIGMTGLTALNVSMSISLFVMGMVIAVVVSKK